MEPSTLTQMNVRIDTSLKSAGDAALSSIGFSPTQAIRALWERAAQRGEQLEAVRRFLVGEANGTHRDPRLDALEAGWQIVPAGLAALGISEGSFADTSTDISELYEEALIDRAKQKGWL